ncbi:bifunctional adenosylcobinamide kinase/adenosylcobinamide-phosphate guanylyltransferase [Paenibacillus sp. N4]|uniref:bifunctional adenosylcobinamide kinase/adenosylcobinamide-phosphate guanylyltransferase n=1 Tax=Paenibacillus vietnamensis TaxID=2590547 RepID=UPI001CD048F7|nr:bifunctional adenosylcobinamide kinase/adenosylcobinamide-phosphate guanylyltransferase [Paenibacillus vietnamensis]MCA0754138.1 bifunctional adenosylcobinamide kinase/adenosylcobinamide-phosphate guanylyltransferase [Paenibacillus vietnamensis]
MAILVTGGARSGKSAFAEQYAYRTGESGIYIATCQAYDEEMRDRIGRHRRDRDESGFLWRTVEEPFEVDRLLIKLELEIKEDTSRGNQPPIVLLDCLTLWLTNWMLRVEADGLNVSRLEEESERLLQAVREYSYPLILVTNEVGSGIVPSYPLGRQFRDAAGRLNQQAAAVCDRVFLVTAGIPVELKSQAFRWEQL